MSHHHWHEGEATRSIILEAIDREQGVVAIVATTVFITQSSVDAVHRASRDIKVIGYGASPENLTAVSRDELAATVDVKPSTQGTEALELIHRLSQQGVCPNGQNPPCPPRYVTPEIVLAKR